MFHKHYTNSTFFLQVFRIAYCQKLRLSTITETQHICNEFVQTVKENAPELLKKVKVHLILHLPQSMADFGPTSVIITLFFILCSLVLSTYCTIPHRCESYNSVIRAKNIFGNRLAPSRDIACGFAILEHLRFICSGGSTDGIFKQVTYNLFFTMQ